MVETQRLGVKADCLHPTLDARRVAVAFFFKTSIDDQVTDIFDHLLVLDVEHTDLGQKKAHIQEYDSREEAERPDYRLDSKEGHAQKYGISPILLQNAVIAGAKISDFSDRRRP